MPHTKFRDEQGLPMSGANPAAADAYVSAIRNMRCLVGDPLAEVERAIAAAPDMPLAHLAKAWLNLIGTEPAGRAVAIECLRAAAELPMDERERGHLAAVTELAAGRWQSAGLLLEDVSAAWPHDELALLAAHQIDFMRGDSRMLRDRIARALPAWDAGRPGWHALLGMYAFGLEECGEYVAAERHGREAVEIEPRDGWAWHAVAHVHEMRGESRRGIEWLRPSRPVWSDSSYLAVHNTWHLALFHLTEGEPEEALRLYDEGIGGPQSPLAIDLVDATAMLWRLRLLGVDVGDRWQTVADRWMAAGPLGHYAFNAVHALMALIGAGREQGRQELLEALVVATHADDDSAVFAREAGLPVARALLAQARGDHREASLHLRRVRNQAQRFGGSHAQRDILDLTLLDAVARAGERPLLAALVAERAAARPGRPIAPVSVSRAQAAHSHVPESAMA
ncbi:tetratricopeptide repeat protein [Arenimonas fontis]|uniref:tetratricopeptide repeat protein n=1 Tax=Arenimonas fontis TaxID=2608255 RepID=UPI001661A6D9|nr:tetratricopeptide repeat protein [Arenimonas fontis]